MNIKSTIWCIFALVCAMSCGKNTQNKNKTSKEVPVYIVKQENTSVSNQFVTDIQAKRNVEIRSRLNGIIQKIYVNEGQSVRKGQPLFKINDAELQMDLLKANATLKQTQADVRIAEVELRQIESLHAKKFVANNELELVKAKLSSAKAKNAFADAERKAVLQKISFTTVTAPFDGVLDVIPHKDGSLVTNGTLLTTLSQLDEVYAYFSIPENVYFELIAHDKLGKHQKIELTLPNGVAYQYKGKLKSAESEIDRKTGSIRYKVLFPNPDHLIKHGASGKLTISEMQNNALMIPQKSTFSIQDKTYIFLVDKNNKVKMTNIKVGTALKDSYLVESGLKKGDLIIYEGTQSLKDGDEIKIKNRL
ncbi:membrane fusion protein, multidrug efflux system [Chryseobacterium taeanense]|uniref:Membrane fusion protein, multidrug efflux system n=1 Tax=Chryseobacterium taeanense TaxID=311334 RepID=A0A1G8FQT2_9FLAO|nr:efflux RND transporter periplasmic adaptor subunit [Chryseobacterium taeanense]SDH84481.1 membrane fusion protein, multidrug efflux system [Chryseobacterium taeanense]